MAETWDESKPAGSRSPTLGDDDIREFKRAVRERLAEDHNFQSTESPAFGAALSTIGKHKFCTLLEQASDKVTAENEISLIAKEVSSKSELHVVPENGGSAVQITAQNVTKLNTIGFYDGTNLIEFPTNGMAAAKLMLGNSNTIAWFYLNTAPPGWKVLSTGADTVIGVAASIYLSSGSATSTTELKLVDSGATFITDGVLIGDTVYNVTDETYSYVTALDSETELSIANDIFASGESYRVGGINSDGGKQMGSWTIKGFSVPSGGSHNHKWYDYHGGKNHETFDSAGNEVDLARDLNPINYRYIPTDKNDACGSGRMLGADSYTSNANHTHPSVDSSAGWRPRASVGKLFQLDTA